jgi:hypothetical protein
MASRTEEILSQALRTILAELPIGAHIPATEDFRDDVLGGLEWWLPDVLGEIHDEWKGESMDGVCSALARKTGDGEAEIFGAAYLMSDQTVVPVFLALQIDPSKDEVSWLLLKLGEEVHGKRGEESKRGMVRSPHISLDSVLHRVYSLTIDADKIDWRYKVTFGERRL